MQKIKEFKLTRFSADVLKLAIDKLRSLGTVEKAPRSPRFKVETDDATWLHETLDEFLADYRKYHGFGEFEVYAGPMTLWVSFYRPPSTTVVRVTGPDRSLIESVLEEFERHAADSKLPQPPAPKPVVFIGHGRSTVWRDLKDHLADKHGYEIEAYETGARAGHTIRDILEDMVAKSTFALLVLTAEDEQSDGQLRARQNVIHEAGLFQGRLGFHRAILLLENGVEEFSNVQGIQYIGFAKGNIRETYGEVLATLRREFS